MGGPKRLYGKYEGHAYEIDDLIHMIFQLNSLLISIESPLHWRK
jgi:hypothetical protein